MRRRNSDDILTILLITLIIFVAIAGSIFFIKIYNDYNIETMRRQTFYAEEGIEENIVESKIDKKAVTNEIIIIANYEIEDKYTKKDYSNTRENSYYYNQLDRCGKEIYMHLFNNIDNLKLGNYIIDYGYKFNDLLNSQDGEAILYNACNLAIQAFIFDNPQVFYIDFEKMYMQTTCYTQGSTKRYEVILRSEENDNYYVQGFINKSQIDDEIAKIEEFRDNINSMCSEKSTYEKIEYIHDWLVDNVTYDETLEKLSIHDMYGALAKKEAVCDGYSKAFKYILDFMNISCIVVSGSGTNSEGRTENHAWNYVKIEENWYAVDVTWDNPIIIGGGTLTNTERYKYFLKGEMDFLVNHTINVDGKINFNVPELNYEDF